MLAVVIALLFVLATLMAMRTTSGWLAALVIMWMVLCWAIALLLRMHLQQGVATCHQKKTCKLRAGRRPRHVDPGPRT